VNAGFGQPMKLELKANGVRKHCLISLPWTIMVFITIHFPYDESCGPKFILGKGPLNLQRKAKG